MRLAKLNNLKYRTPTLDMSDVEPSLFACASLAFKFTSTDDSDLNEVTIWRKRRRRRRIYSYSMVLQKRPRRRLVHKFRYTVEIDASFQLASTDDFILNQVHVCVFV